MVGQGAIVVWIFWNYSLGEAPESPCSAAKAAAATCDPCSATADACSGAGWGVPLRRAKWGPSWPRGRVLGGRRSSAKVWVVRSLRGLLQESLTRDLNSGLFLGGLWTSGFAIPELWIGQGLEEG
jgi:hypothetical protein